jgi:hypothetical protein
VRRGTTDMDFRTTSRTPRTLRARRARRAAALGALLLGGAVTFACSEVGTGPNEPAAIEFAPFPSPSVVIGDTLRDLSGAVAPVRAIVRNVRGEIIADAPVQYLYADNARDTAVVIDPGTGIVRALRPSTGDVRIAARVGGALQVLRTLVVTTRPDSLDGSAVGQLLTTTIADTGRTGANANTSQPFSVTVRHRESATSVTAVNAWPVRFELLKPANPSNDTTAAVFLVDDNGRASVIDTTNAGGTASRRVRVRAALFPAGTATDSVIVRATATYRGQIVGSDTVRIAVPVKRGT